MRIYTAENHLRDAYLIANKPFLSYARINRKHQHGADIFTDEPAPIELAGHNLANVSNPAYARQRLKLQTSTGSHRAGLQGGGVEITGVEHFRDYLLDRQVANEQSVLRTSNIKQKILQYTQAAIGQELDRASSSAEGNAASQGVSGQMGLGDNPD